jgi:hypothetical protein
VLSRKRKEVLFAGKQDLGEAVPVNLSFNANYAPLSVAFAQKCISEIHEAGIRPAVAQMSVEQVCAWHSLAVTVQVVDRGPLEGAAAIKSLGSVAGRIWGIPIDEDVNLKEDRILFKDTSGQIVAMIFNLQKPKEF